MNVSMVKHQDFRLFRRTDVVSENVIIFAHGRNTGSSFDLPDALTMYFYIDDDHTFDFMRQSFLWALQGLLKPRQTLSGAPCSDYLLEKAAGEGITDPSARQSYEALRALVSGSGATARAVLPRPAEDMHLGRGVTCDILSIRNRMFRAAPMLSAVLAHPAVTQYARAHAFFSRARQHGSTPHGQAPQKVPRH